MSEVKHCHMNRGALERRADALARSEATLRADLAECRAEKERLRKLSLHLQSTIDRIRAACGPGSR
jgi:predicted  nucleic acid-binding Zn-ribbon protein